MRRLSRAYIKDEKAEVDLTSMLDVVFIVLIFFVVTASFLKESAIPVRQSISPEESQNDGASLVININSSGEIEVDRRRVDVRALRSLVAQFLAENPNGATVIRAHELASTQKYVAVADQIQKVTRGNFALKTYAGE